MRTGLLGPSIVPNPASNDVTIYRSEANDLHYEILDALGTVTISGNSSAAQIPIDVSSLLNGIYYLRLRSLNAVESMRKIAIVR
jgi:hypothetical protein